MSNAKNYYCLTFLVNVVEYSIIPDPDTVLSYICSDKPFHAVRIRCLLQF